MNAKLVGGITLAAVVVVLLASFLPFFQIEEDGDVLDVFIIDGQSNAAYQNVSGSVDLDVINDTLGNPNKSLFYYGTSSRPTMYHESDTNYAIHPIYVDGDYKIGGLVAPFAYYLAKANNNDVLVLDVGISAQSINNLVPGTVGGNWKISVISDALSSITGYDYVNMVGWAWLQGESDTNMAVNTYMSYFNDLEDYYASIDCPDCYIVKTRLAYGGNATIAQNNLIAENPNIHLGTDITDSFTGTDYMLDNLHYSQAARIIIAEKVVQVIPVEDSKDWGSVNPILAVIPVLIILAVVVGIFALTMKSREKD